MSVNTRPYRRGSKNDRADTKALLEAYRPTGLQAYRNEEILRMLLTQGGRAVLRAANVSKRPPDKLRACARKVHRSRGHNKAAIAIGKKLARIVWAASTREGEFQSVPVAA